MYQNLPPLNALRAFEAAARHESFSRAADELHLTHGAVSRGVRQLEELLGQTLFRRTTRSVTLTQTGAVYAQEVGAVLDRLMRATVRARAQSSTGALTISTLDSFASKWLLPRLHGFRRAHPDIDVRISTDDRLVDFVHDDIDLALRFGKGSYPGLECDFLMDEDLYPVCSPDLLTGDNALRTPDDLRHHALIHDVFFVDWKMWLTAAGVEDVDVHKGATYQSSDLGIQAAIQGEGVVLGRSALVEDDLAAGRLVRPFDLALPVGYAYYVVYPAAALDTPKVKAFRDWIVAEARREPRMPSAG